MEYWLSANLGFSRKVGECPLTLAKEVWCPFWYPVLGDHGLEAVAVFFHVGSLDLGMVGTEMLVFLR